MEYFVALIVFTASAIITLLLICMIIRAIMSFFAPESESGFAMTIFTLTEIVVNPVRMLITKLGWFQNLPIDMAFIFTYIILFIIQMILPTVSL